MPLRLLAAILTLSAATLSLAWPDSPRSPSDGPHRRLSDSKPVVVALPPDIETAQFLAYVEGVVVTQYLDALAVTAYLDALEAERQATEARAVLAAQTAAARPAPVSHPAATIAGACGGATNGADAYIARESGGNPGVYNAGGSGAWGCYQIMPGTWNGACSDIGQYGSASPAQQAACASRLPLSAWGG